MLELATGVPACGLYPRHPSAERPVPLQAPGDSVDPANTTPVLAGEEVLGRLHVEGGTPLTALQRKAIEHGATVIALELVKEQAMLEAEWRLQGELLEELLRCSGPLPDGLARRAERFGVDLSVAHRLSALAPNAGTTPAALLEFIRRGLRSRGHLDAFVAQRGEHVLIALADTSDRGLRALVADLQQRGRRAGLGFRAGVSNARTNFSAALREAEGALSMAQSPDRSSDDPVGYEDLGPLRFLLDAPNTSEMRSLVEDALGALAAHDRRRQSDLLFTLRAYLAAGGHHPTTADGCHIHVSTLKYRLAQISKVLGRNLSEPATRFELNLAIEVLNVLEAMGAAPFSATRSAGELGLVTG